MSKISKNVLNKIEKKHIKPLPKWHFALLHAVMWSLFIVTILLGSLATGMILFSILNTDWALAGRLAGGKAIVFLPYIWFALFGIMIFVASKLYTHTHQGYKIKPLHIAVISVLIAIALGSVMYAVRASEGFERALREHVKPYGQLQEIREKIYQAPEQGVLPGRVVEVKSDSLIILDDLSGKTWEVDISNADFPPHAAPKEGVGIVAEGEKISENKFRADIIKPKIDFRKGLGKLREKKQSLNL